MTTEAKIDANRENALASTGPTTAEGKAIVSCNAMRHGLLSWKPVIPGFETAEDWESHLDKTVESLAPVGHIEALLVERVALLFWRLARVARYERDDTAVALEQAEGRKRPKLERVEQTIGIAQAAIDFMEGLQTLPPDSKLEQSSAAGLLTRAAEFAYVDLYEMRGWPNYVNGTDLDDVDWTAARLSECMQLVGKQVSMGLDELIGGMTQQARDNLKEAQGKRDKLLVDTDHERRSLLLPDDLTLSKVNRYETTLERSLFKTLHELERRQAARAGRAVPLPMAVDVNLSRPAQD
ncbi:MAG: hypothetical protein ABSF29_05965 [Tepidisphaeraceae bacterium]|jgi:hypothetical protein